MIRRIAIEHLKKGMYVLDSRIGEPLEPPLYSVEGYILSTDEAARLKEQGFHSAWVDDSRFTLVPYDLHLEAGNIDESLLADVHKTYSEEQRRASVLYAEGIAVARCMHERIRTHQELDLSEYLPLFQSLVQSLQSNKDVLLSLGKIRNKDEYTYSHCVNVGLYTMVLGRYLEVSPLSLPELGLAGFFHDVGKIFVPEEVLTKPGKLTPEQFSVMREHPQLGLKYLEEAQLPRSVCLAALEHHERHAGHGYPFGKKSDEISFIGQVVAVADVFDAISSQRSYKKALSPSEALSIMYQTKDQDFGPEIMEAFISSLGVYPCGTLVKLSNRCCAVVTEQNEKNRMRPVVVLLSDAYGAPVTRPRIVDLSVHLTISIAKPISELPCSLDVDQAVAFAYL